MITRNVLILLDKMKKKAEFGWGYLAALILALFVIAVIILIAVKSKNSTLNIFEDLKGIF